MQDTLALATDAPRGADRLPDQDGRFASDHSRGRHASLSLRLMGLPR